MSTEFLISRQRTSNRRIKVCSMGINTNLLQLTGLNYIFAPFFFPVWSPANFHPPAKRFSIHQLPAKEGEGECATHEASKLDLLRLLLMLCHGEAQHTWIKMCMIDRGRESTPSIPPSHPRPISFSLWSLESSLWSLDNSAITFLMDPEQYLRKFHDWWSIWRRVRRIYSFITPASLAY